MKKPTTLLGVTILTPALIAGEAHATAPRTSAVAAVPHATAFARLNAGMLALDPAAKLKLAADRLPATSTSTSTTTTHSVAHSAISATCHTQHNNVHHNAITQPTSAVANTSANPSGGAPSASPSTSAVQQTHGALTPPPPQGYQAPQQGVTKGVQAPARGVTKGSN